MKCCDFFNTACNMLESVKANDFNTGFATGVCLALLVIFLLLVIKIVFKLIFRRKRCKELIKEEADGNITVTVGAIEDTVRNELAAFNSVKIGKIRLYRKGRKYILNLFCDYDGKSGSLPQISQDIKSAINNMFQKFFGVDSVKTITLKFEHISRYGVTSDSAEENDQQEQLPEKSEEAAPVPVADNQDDIF